MPLGWGFAILGTGFTPPAKPLLHSDWRSGSDYALHKPLWGDSFSENFRSECRHAFSTLDQDLFNSLSSKVFSRRLTGGAAVAL
jgi:hypothetical protein